MNRVMLSGRTTKDIKLKGEDRLGKPFTKFTIAVNREFGTGVDYIDCVAFGKVAQTLKKRTSRGSRIYVEGYWRTGKYTSFAGITVWSNVVWVRYVEIIDWRWDKAEDRLPPEFARREINLDAKYPELAIADEPLDADTEQGKTVMKEVTVNDPYMP